MKLLFIGRGFVVAASILEGDYFDKYQHIEPVRSVSIFILIIYFFLLMISYV